MFIYLLYKNRTKIWKDIDAKSQKFRVFGVGVAFYTTLHFLLFSDFIDGSGIVGQMRKYIFVLFILDLLVVYYLDQIEGCSSEKPKKSEKKDKVRRLSKSKPISKPKSYHKSYNESYHKSYPKQTEYDPEETVKECDTRDFNFTDTEPTMPKFKPHFDQDIISVESSLPVYRRDEVPIYRP